MRWIASQKLKWIVPGVISFLGACSGTQQEKNVMKEIQLTTGAYGHTLNAAQVFSPDDQWVVYDTRNDDTHISRTGTIEKVNVRTGEIVKVYTTTNQTLYGPGVGAAAYHPTQNKIIFIHGLLNCTEEHPYGFTRRFGAIVQAETDTLIHAEARTIHEPLIPGALRGGTHAHTWSSDGRWISFTYNDHLLEALEKSTQGKVKDLRTIGVMAPLKNVKTSVEDAEEFSGEYFTVVTATVIESPTNGSDEIERAFDECWIGRDGYRKKDGSHQKRAITFQGNVRNAEGTVVTEVFVADVPDDITKAQAGKPLEGTLQTRPNVPKGLSQRRITFTQDRKHPGVQGPRCRLRTSPDGNLIYFPMKDEAGIIQVFSVPTAGGSIRQVTHFEQSIQAQFNVSPDGKHLSCIADNTVWLVKTETGEAERITEKSEEPPAGGALWSHNGKILVFNRVVSSGSERYFQIVKIDLVD